MIEDLAGDLWMIDFNVRFPAWIFASTFSGCNLPGMLIEHAMYNDSLKRRISSDDSQLDMYRMLPGKREASQNAGAAFTRSTIEIPRSNCTIERTMRLPACILSDHAHQNKGGRGAIIEKNGDPIPILPNKTTSRSKSKISDEDSTGMHKMELNLPDDVDKDIAHDTIRAIAGVVQSIEKDVTTLCKAAHDLLVSEPCYTPRRVLCMASVKESLERHQRIFSMAARQARLKMSKYGTRIHPMNLQLCLSVKVKPHTAFLSLSPFLSISFSFFLPLSLSFFLSLSLFLPHSLSSFYIIEIYVIFH